MKKIFFVFLLIISTSYIPISVSRNISSPHLPSTKPLKIGVIIKPPYIIQNKNKYSGFIIDIWQAIIQLHPLNYQFINVGNDYDQAIIDLTQHKYDLLLGDYVLTSKREDIIDYTHPFLLTYISILSKEKNTSNQLISHIFLLRYIYLFIAIIITLITCSYLYYKMELKEKFTKNLVNKKEKSHFYAIWLVAKALLSGSMPRNPQTTLGRTMFIFIILISILFTSLLTAGLTSSAILLEEDKSKFNNLSSLQGKTFLLWGNSSYNKNILKKYLAKYKIIPLTKNIGQIYLENQNKYAGIIADLPVNIYIKTMANNNSLKIAPIKLEQQILSFITPSNSPYLEILNQSLLKLIENGKLKKICQNYFKEENESCITSKLTF